MEATEAFPTICCAECPCSGGPVSTVNSCVALRNLSVALQNVFGYSEFRPGQLKAMLPALHGKDTLVRMATGAGKSLCMFLVLLAYSDTAVGVIVSPLNLLMDEQVIEQQFSLLQF